MRKGHGKTGAVAVVRFPWAESCLRTLGEKLTCGASASVRQAERAKGAVGPGYACSRAVGRKPNGLLRAAC